MPVKMRWVNTLLFNLLMVICSVFYFSGLEHDHAIGLAGKVEGTVILPVTGNAGDRNFFREHSWTNRKHLTKSTSCSFRSFLLLELVVPRDEPLFFH